MSFRAECLGSDCLGSVCELSLGFALDALNVCLGFTLSVYLGSVWNLLCLWALPPVSGFSLVSGLYALSVCLGSAWGLGLV